MIGSSAITKKILNRVKDLPYRSAFKWGALSTVMLIVILASVDIYVAHTASSRIYASVEAVPYRKAAVVLGTTKYAQRGRQNLYYRYRLDAVAQLFKQKKVDAILISGDNATRYYNEPVQMQKDLIARGIPNEYITLDYAGFRTLDSMVRARKVFDLQDYTVVSQRFHCERAIYIAMAKGYDNVVAFQAEGVSGVFSWRVRLREVLARLNAFLDVNLFNTEPKFLGDKVPVPIRLEEENKNAATVSNDPHLSIQQTISTHPSIKNTEE